MKSHQSHDADDPRYHRHHILPGIGREGQRALKTKRVAIIGLGGLGSPVALYLAAAGVGALTLIDPDIVEISNLQRQVIHSCDTLGQDKAVSAAGQIAKLNPRVEISICVARLVDHNTGHLLTDCDVAVGCVDSIDARYAINAACVRTGIPNVYGSAEGYDGQVSVFPAGGRPCYRCFFREPPAAGAGGARAAGVFAPLPGVIGSIMAAETLKVLLDLGAPLAGRLLVMEALEQRFRELAIKPDPDCPVCGGRSRPGSGPGA